MAIAARLSAWWMRWRIVFVLVLLLAGSAWLNVWQFRRAGQIELRAENHDLKQSITTSQNIAKKAQQDSEDLLRRLEVIAARGQQVRTVYRQAAAAAPLADNCAPGQGRMDALNQFLGPQQRQSPGEAR